MLGPLHENVIIAFFWASASVTCFSVIFAEQIALEEEELDAMTCCLNMGGALFRMAIVVAAFASSPSI